ncbi:Uncharacterized conserved protein, contains JmjC domain [Phaffia rhodozyma]|uniref:Uncharacterized conserved protein, contains JmjC domain n=1 Tax=Phaffia rhodozyma TaxID=264483 RepID=A0A0F7SS75_PHARH|nr:Uncharacterized conserved protein, contains JmjC domain [Phaffia rhodozyma]
MVHLSSSSLPVSLAIELQKDWPYRTQLILQPPSSLWPKPRFHPFPTVKLHSLLDDEHWETAVARLDMTLIVAGAPNREETIHTLIEFIQRNYLPPSVRTSSLPAEPRNKRTKFTHDSPSEEHQLLLAPNPILSFDHAPSLSAYLNKYSQTPFIVRSHLIETGWPAICEQDSTWKDKTYLVKAVGRGRIVPVEIGGEYTSEGWGQGMVPFEQFLDRVGWGSCAAWSERYESDQEASKEPALYLAQHSLLNQFPVLRKDILLPDYVFSGPEEDVPKGYKPPSNEEALVINVWVGGNGRSSPSHTDPFYNCYAQVVGQKRIFLTPPTQSDAMYPFSSSTSSALSDSSSTESTSFTAHLLSNTSQVPIFTPDNRPPDRDTYPKFYSDALGCSLEGVLNEGDMLVMPFVLKSL